MCHETSISSNGVSSFGFPEQNSPNGNQPLGIFKGWFSLAYFEQTSKKEAIPLVNRDGMSRLTNKMASFPGRAFEKRKWK